MGDYFGSDLSSEPLTIRPATKADLDAITTIIEAGFPDDPGCDYKFPYRHKYPEDFRKWTRREYEGYLNQPEKFASFVAVAPVARGDTISSEPVAIGVWDIAVETKSTGGDRGIYERRDVNLKHIEAYGRVMERSFAKYFAVYGEEQLHLWMLITHPDFRRRGAGTLLCDWGEEEATKRGWMLTVMASPMGKLLYEHLGYKLVGSETVRADGEEEAFDIDSLVKKTAS